MSRFISMVSLIIASAYCAGCGYYVLAVKRSIRETGVNTAPDTTETERYHEIVVNGLAKFRETGTGGAIGRILAVEGRHRDGHEFPIEHSLTAVRHRGAWHAVAVLRDVSDRRQSEDALIESERRFRAIADYAYDWDFWLDPEGRLQWVNLAAERMIGYSADECRAMADYPLALIHDSDKPFVSRHLLKARAEDFDNDVEFRVVVKNGSVIWVGASYQPVYDTDESFLGSRWSIRDVTDRKRAEDDLRKSESTKRAIVDSSLDCIVTMDHEGRVVEFNPAAEATFGFGREEVVGRQLGDLIIPEHLRDAHHGGLARYLQSGKANILNQRLELSAIRSDGTEFPVELTVTVVQTGERPLFTGFLRDLTSSKAAEAALAAKTDELERSNDELQQFAYVVSHDLQEPLRMVSSYMGLLKNRYGDKLGDEADEFIEFAVDGTERMRHLIKDLLAYSRVGTRGKPFEPTPLEQILDEALSNLQVRIEETGATVKRGPMPTLGVDGSQIVRLFQNLIGNSLKYAKSDVPPEIDLSARKEDGAWVFSIRDNGIGIPEEQFERIFGVFQRLHGRGEYEGTGIGLAICKKIVERHGGRIWVESEAGVGSTFRFRLPEKPGSP